MKEEGKMFILLGVKKKKYSQRGKWKKNLIEERKPGRKTNTLERKERKTEKWTDNSISKLFMQVRHVFLALWRIFRLANTVHASGKEGHIIWFVRIWNENVEEKENKKENLKKQNWCTQVHYFEFAKLSNHRNEQKINKQDILNWFSKPWIHCPQSNSLAVIRVL